MDPINWEAIGVVLTVIGFCLTVMWYIARWVFRLITQINKISVIEKAQDEQKRDMRELGERVDTVGNRIDAKINSLTQALLSERVNRD